MEPTIIRRSRTTLYGCVIAGAVSIFIFFFGPFGDAQKMYNDNTGSVVFFFLLCSGLLVYGFIGLFAKKGEIILSEEGIEIKNKGFNHWEYVSSISTIVEKDNESSDKDFLIIGLKDHTEGRCSITDLDRPGWVVLRDRRIIGGR